MQKQTAITRHTEPLPLAVMNDIMAEAGHAANEAAKEHVFKRALDGRAKNTERRKKADVDLFETFLQSAGIPAAGLYGDPQAWRGVTWGVVEGFKIWMLNQGYAIASINSRLSTVRSYAELAAKAGAIADGENRLIASVRGYTHKEAVHVDERRKANNLATRIGHKKAQATAIPEELAERLINQPNTPQGRRDSLLMCLLLEHGLRVSEVAILTRQSFDLKANTFSFYRPKVDVQQTHELSPNTRKAAGLYLKYDAPREGILWRKSHKGTGKLSTQLSEISATRALTKRVELLGRKVDIEGLSAHDGRHFWATFEARHGTAMDRLQQAGGWKSLAMPMRYIADAEIANAGTARLRNSD